MPRTKCWRVYLFPGCPGQRKSQGHQASGPDCAWPQRPLMIMGFKRRDAHKWVSEWVWKKQNNSGCRTLDSGLGEQSYRMRELYHPIALSSPRRIFVLSRIQYPFFFRTLQPAWHLLTALAGSLSWQHSSFLGFHAHQLIINRWQISLLGPTQSIKDTPRSDTATSCCLSR